MTIYKNLDFLCKFLSHTKGYITEVQSGRVALKLSIFKPNKCQ